MLRSEGVLDLGSLCKGQGILDIDTEVTHRAFDLGMTKQDLNSAKVAGRAVYDRSLRPPQRMRAVVLLSQTDRRHPLIHETSILSSAEVGGVIDAARKGVIIDRSAASLQPCQQARACCFHEFELYWPLRLTLHHDGA